MRTTQRNESGRWVTVQIPATREAVEAEFYRTGMRHEYRIVEGRRVVMSIRRRNQAQQYLATT